MSTERATGCVFSPCRRYRYALFIGRNTSTAEEVRDDPTVRRCLGSARSWRYDGLYVTNHFAFRAADPEIMKAQPDPAGRTTTAGW